MDLISPKKNPNTVATWGSGFDIAAVKLLVQTQIGGMQGLNLNRGLFLKFSPARA